MESLKELYRIGRGPSSSHTIAPTGAAEIFLKEYPDAFSYRGNPIRFSFQNRKKDI